MKCEDGYSVTSKDGSLCKTSLKSVSRLDQVPVKRDWKGTENKRNQALLACLLAGCFISCVIGQRGVLPLALRGLIILPDSVLTSWPDLHVVTEQENYF